MPEAVRSVRAMVSVVALKDDRALLLYRMGSRVLPRGQWVGVGGHMEAADGGDPMRCCSREWEEETGLPFGALRNPRIRYLAMRQAGAELRQNYYLFAEWPDGPETPPPCPEGTLAWKTRRETAGLDSPFTFGRCLAHHWAEGAATDALYLAAPTYEGGALAMRFVPLASY